MNKKQWWRNAIQSLFAFLRALVGSCKKVQRRNDDKRSYGECHHTIYLELWFRGASIPLLCLWSLVFLYWERGSNIYPFLHHTSISLFLFLSFPFHLSRYHLIIYYINYCNFFCCSFLFIVLSKKLMPLVCTSLFINHHL